MKYAEHVKNEFGEQYIFEIGDKAITNQNIECMIYSIKKGTEVTVTGISHRGYDIVDSRGIAIDEIGFNRIEHVSK